MKGVNNVADHLSRVPGTEELEAPELCSLTSTLGLHHASSDWQPVVKSGVGCANAVISVYDSPPLLQSLLRS